MLNVSGAKFSQCVLMLNVCSHGLRTSTSENNTSVEYRCYQCVCSATMALANSQNVCSLFAMTEWCAQVECFAKDAVRMCALRQGRQRMCATPWTPLTVLPKIQVHS